MTRTEPEGLADQPGAGRRETWPRRRGPAWLNTGPGGPAPPKAMTLKKKPRQRAERKDSEDSSDPVGGAEAMTPKKAKDGEGPIYKNTIPQGGNI